MPLPAPRGIRYLALLALLVVSSCVYLLHSSVTPLGTGYISPSTVLPDYVSSSGIPACEDVQLDLTPFEERQAGTAESGREDRIPVKRILEYMQRHLNDRQGHFDPMADKAWLGIDIGSTWDLPSYRRELMDNYATYLSDPERPQPAYMQLIQSRLSLLPHSEAYPPRPRQILTTTKEPLPWSFKRWRSLHRGWKLRIFGDEALRDWVAQQFGGTRAEEVWVSLPRAVLKTDVFRYMAMLVEGGVYTDSDTAPVIPADQWGRPYQNATDHLLSHLSRVLAQRPSISNINTEETPSSVANAKRGSLTPASSPPADEGGDSDLPSLVISIESDAIDFGWDNWRENGLVRAVQIVQWTMMARPGHPVFLDAIGRALRKTEQFAEMEKQALEKGEVFTPESALEWTGPGIFTDCVYRYLLARYGFHPRELLHLKTPLRIGDVLILPAGSFHSISPWDPKDTWRPHAAVWHGFWGRWRAEDGSELQRELANQTKEAQGRD